MHYKRTTTTTATAKLKTINTKKSDKFGTQSQFIVIKPREELHSHLKTHKLNTKTNNFRSQWVNKNKQQKLVAAVIILLITHVCVVAVVVTLLRYEKILCLSLPFSEMQMTKHIRFFPCFFFFQERATENNHHLTLRD